MNYHSNSIIAEFLDVTYANLFVPLILRPTRIISHSASLIDNIFTNSFCNDIVSGLFFTDVSDHLPNFAIHYEQGVNNDGKKSFVSFCDKNTANITKFHERLRSTDWINIYNYTNVNTAYSCLAKRSYYEAKLKSLTANIKESSFSSFFFESATQCKMVEIANSLRINTTAGHDKVSMWSVKESINYISEPLTYIINLSINSGVVPDQMKLARVVPLFKSDDKRLFSNYRPVSVLPFFSKFLEKIAYIRLINYIDKHKLLANIKKIISMVLGKITVLL